LEQKKKGPDEAIGRLTIEKKRRWQGKSLRRKTCGGVKKGPGGGRRAMAEHNPNVSGGKRKKKIGQGGK